MIRLANTAEPLYLAPREANYPSREGVDFSSTAEFDPWDDQGLRFVFGADAQANLVERAEGTPDQRCHELVAQGPARGRHQSPFPAPERERRRGAGQTAPGTSPGRPGHHVRGDGEHGRVHRHLGDEVLGGGAADAG
jgi:hypothetical protein